MPTNAVQQMAIANQVLEDSLHVPGKIGRAEADGSYTIHVENKPNFVYVRVGTGEATGVIEAYNLHAPFKQDLRVICRKELNGDYVILGLDQGGGFLGVGDYNSPYHQHDHDSGLGWVVPGLQMEAGRVYFLDNFTVAIAPFRYKHGSDWYTYIGGTLDLSGDMPSTSGAHAWILIHVDPATGVAAATTGAEYAYATPLTISLLDDISIGDDIPLAAIMGREDAADLSDYALYYDAHGWFNLPGAGGGGGSSDWDDLTDVPANISELAAATSAADTLFYFDGVGSGAVTGLTGFGRSIIDDVDAAAARTTLGLAAGGAGDIWVEKAGDTMSGALDMGTTNKVVNLADPTSAQDAATKAYVDAVLQALDIKASVRAATTANITLSGAQTIDGVIVIAGDRVLVKNQSTGADNGIYVAAAGTWARSADANVSAEVTAGMYTFVAEGTANGDNGWVLTTNDPITLGSTALVFTQFSGAGQITAGSGLSKTGNTLDVNVDNTTIEISADTLQVKNLGITYAKIQNVTATDKILGRVSASAGVIEEITFTDQAQQLADDSSFGAMRTTLGLGSIATETETNYVLVAGTRILTGDWDIGEDRRILAEAFRARDGEGVMIEDDAGNVGIYIADLATRIGLGTSSLKAIASGLVAVQIGSGGYLLAQNSTANINVAANAYYDGAWKRMFSGVPALFEEHTGAFQWLTAATGAADSTITWTSAMQLTAAGLLGVGITPQSRAHFHDGTAGWMFTSKTGTMAADVELISTATGKPVRGVQYRGVVYGSTSGPSNVNVNYIAVPGAGSTSATMFGNITVKLYSTGQFVTVRSGGTETWTVALEILWI